MAAGILVPGSNGQTPALIADKVLSYPSQNGLPASGPGGVANFTTVTVAGAQVSCSAALELQSTTGALIVPRMTAAQRLLLVPTNGMDVYELDTQARWWYNNGSWTQVSTGGGGGGGDVSGPGASTLNSLVFWNNTLGTVVASSHITRSVNAFDVTADDLSHVGSIYASKAADSGGAAPNYSFFGDSGTGIWSSGDNAIDFSAAGVEQFRITGANTAVNFLTIMGEATGLPIVLSAANSADANVSIAALVKGTGSLSVASTLNTQPGSLHLQEASTNGNNYVGFISPAALAANVVWTLPSLDATSANQPLVSNAAGVLSFFATPLSTFVSATGTTTDANRIPSFTGTANQIQESVATVAPVTGTVTLAANGQFIAGLGTVTNPAFTFLGDTNTGIYRISAEHTAFTANGELQFVIQDGAGTAINSLFVQAGATTVAPSFGINTTTDANVDIAAAAKGTGGLLINPTSGASTAGILKLGRLDGANFSGFTASATADGSIWTLPAADGTAGQALVTNGSKVLSFATATTTVSGSILVAAARAAYTTPISLVAAAGANTVIIVERISVEFVGATPFVGSGNFVIEYGNVAHGTGPSASGSILNASFVGLGASTILFSNPTVASIVVSTAVNTGVFLSATGGADFTGGGALNYSIQYYVMTTT